MDDIQKTIFESRLHEIMNDFPQNEDDFFFMVRIDRKSDDCSFCIAGYPDDLGLSLLYLADEDDKFRTAIIEASSIILAQNN